MQSFRHWLKENGLRTSLGIYPPAYGVGQYPPLYFTPISAGAANALTNIHHVVGKKKKKKKKN
jgi:hypothetical protein